ncbi:hypothetical protein BYT27DRAFT_7333929 [Phlegmacium glaucopus]|nr:hypothetical protein BYT27DRAFT_7333929 [Phlegmacium glaucopus]
MEPGKESVFSAPWTRANLMNTPTYVASEEFKSQLMWVKGTTQNDLMIVLEKCNNKPTIRATCVVVGIISSKRLFLEPHGNYNPNFNSPKLEASKAQFMLTAPPVDGVFNVDFKLGIEHLEKIQNKAVLEGNKPQHFIVVDGEQTGMKFSWPLFEKREFAYDSQDEEDWSNRYPIAENYKTTFKAIVHKWRATPLLAYDESGNFIKVLDHEFLLKRALVLVYFNLKHYAIRDKKTNHDGIAGNTFTAIASQIMILERPAKRNTSPYKTQLLKGPITLPRSPTKLKEQVEAVNAFHQGTHAKTNTLKPAMIVDSPADEPASSRSTGSKIPDQSTNPSTTPPHDSNQHEVKPFSNSKAQGKKRAIDDDEDATAMEGEVTNAANSFKKKKKATK